MTDDWVPPARSPKDVPDEPPPPTLAEFLLARLTETEQVAQTALAWADDGGPWSAHGEFPSRGGAIFDHVALHDPARVLAEVAAHRRIVELHHEATVSRGMCHECMCALPCMSLRLLALPHAAHPQYRPEWAP